MAYLGRDIQYGTLTKQTFTANGITTVFTLDEGVSGAGSLLVSIGGVIQEPISAYTAIGTVLTFDSAPSNGADVWAIKLGSETGSSEVRTEKTTHQTGVGNGTTTPFALNKIAPNSSSIIVTLDGLVQKPEIEFTVDRTTLTLSSSPAASVKIIIYFLANPFALTSVVDGSITAAKLNSTGTLPAWNGSNLTNLTAANLTGALPALDASAVTNLGGGFDTKTGSDPLITSNKILGHLWLNTTSGELFCCTNATTNNNIWTNIGEGSGDISNTVPTNPNNTGSFVTPMTESTSYNFTFAGATDPDSGDSVTHYMVDTISNGALTVAAAEVVAGQPHVFTAAAVGADTAVTFRVRAKDSFGAYSSGITVNMVLDNDTVPTNATNGGAFADMNQSASYNYTFAGGTDDKAGFSYVVDQISNAALTVSSAEVASGSAHTFNSGAVGSDTAVTFRVRTKDSVGQYSTGITVSMTVLSIVYTTATGGTKVPIGDYYVHTFTGNGTFQIQSIGTDTDIDFLIIGGGGSAGSSYGGGGGAGGFKTSFGTSGANSAALAKVNASTVGIANFAVTIGNGPAGRSAASGVNGGNSSVAWGTHTETANGGGAGGFYSGVAGVTSSDAVGGCGGGSASNDGGEVNGSAGMAGQGMAGGNGSGGYYNGQLWGAGGGGGASAVGNNSNGNNGGDGGAGLYSTITGSNVPYGGGGGGSGYLTPAKGDGGVGGGGNSSNNSNIAAEHGDANTGGGAGGGHQVSGGNGGSGIVVLRYKYQN